ncbi:hypothetical protein EAF00_005225 [Botryotinia globosa]|nr:hypothetical protein EAF00_005225 [Botryotinia globosa]
MGKVIKPGGVSFEPLFGFCESTLPSYQHVVRAHNRRRRWSWNHFCFESSSIGIHHNITRTARRLGDFVVRLLIELSTADKLSSHSYRSQLSIFKSVGDRLCIVQKRKSVSVCFNHTWIALKNHEQHGGKLWSSQYLSMPQVHSGALVETVRPIIRPPPPLTGSGAVVQQVTGV